MTKFKVGDKVVSTAGKDVWHSGLEGFVVRVPGDGHRSTEVEFPGATGGHSGTANDSRTTRWNFYTGYHAAYDDALSLLKKVVEKKKPSQEYKGNGKHKWEAVVFDGEDFEVCNTMRLRVPGGWLYKNDYASAMTFVPMPEVVKHKV